MSLACKCLKNWKAVDLLIKISLGINEAALGSLTMCYSIEDVDKTVTTHTDYYNLLFYIVVLH